MGGDASQRSQFLVTAQCCIDFRRCLIQALDVSGDVELLQIPHFTHEILREVQRGKKKVMRIREWIDQPPDARKGLVGMDIQQMQDIQEFLNHFPRVELTYEV